MAQSRPEDYPTEAVRIRPCNFEMSAGQTTAHYTDGPLTGIPFVLMAEDGELYWKRSNKRSQCFPNPTAAIAAFKQDELILRPIGHIEQLAEFDHQLPKAGGISDESAYSVGDLHDKLIDLETTKQGYLKLGQELEAKVKNIRGEYETVLEEIARRAGCRRGDRVLVRIRGRVFELDRVGQHIQFNEQSIPELCPVDEDTLPPDHADGL